MKSETDPNVIYGGDPENVIDDSILSLGSMMQEDIKIGGDRKLLVSRKFQAQCSRSIILLKLLQDQRKDE